MKTDIQHLINLRQTLHQNPELSGNEEYTAEALKRTIIRFQPDDIIDNIGGYGVAFIYNGKEPGPSIMFRAEIDALPIFEVNDLDYASRTEGVSHQCGHDGHMAILVGLAEQISNNRPKRGKVILLFQPAEETGEGALLVIEDPNYYRLEPELCFALHNIPGYPKGSIILKDNTFSAASQGIIIKLRGKTSHAAEPEKGKSPAIAMSKIIESITKLPEKKYLFNDYVLSTVVHARLGEQTFGTSPGFAKILLTLRAFDDEDMLVLLKHTTNVIRQISDYEGLKVDISYTDIYPSTQNNPPLIKIISENAADLKFDIIKLEEPFPWAEDFAQFSQKYKSAIFGLGAGENSAKLHNANYNFPDEIIPYGIEMFHSIYEHFFIK